MADTNDALDMDGAIYKTLLESTQAIPWRIDWASSQFTYIGPQIENLLGWEPSSWVSVQDWARACIRKTAPGQWISALPSPSPGSTTKRTTAR